jgi:acyl-CoA thioesterase
VTAGAERDAQKLAEASASAMWEDDHASQGLGMRIDRIAPGEAVLSMTVRPDMTNGHGMCHGGFIFLLADSAFAFACNSDGHRTVAEHCAISFLHPARTGERLVATAVEKAKRPRSGIYDITVRNGEGMLIAEFRGHSRRVGGTFVEAESGASPPHDTAKS